MVKAAAKILVQVPSRHSPDETEENPGEAKLGWLAARLEPICLPIADPKPETLTARIYLPHITQHK